MDDAEPVRAHVGIGANLGDARVSVEQAIVRLGQLPGTRLVARSSLYRSAPVEAEGPDFVNAAVALDTSLDAEALLAQLQALERAHGRERPFRHAPRTLDLDLLTWGQRVSENPLLTLPHPRLHLRAFVLEPLFELAPGLALPRLGPIAVWRQRAQGQRIERLAPAGR